MARDTIEHTAPDGERPFERFQKSLKTLLSVPKKEIDEAVHAHYKKREQSKGKGGN